MAKDEMSKVEQFQEYADQVIRPFRHNFSDRKLAEAAYRAVMDNEAALAFAMYFELAMREVERSQVEKSDALMGDWQFPFSNGRPSLN